MVLLLPVSRRETDSTTGSDNNQHDDSKGNKHARIPCCAETADGVASRGLPAFLATGLGSDEDGVASDRKVQDVSYK